MARPQGTQMWIGGRALRNPLLQLIFSLGVRVGACGCIMCAWLKYAYRGGSELRTGAQVSRHSPLPLSLFVSSNECYTTAHTHSTFIIHTHTHTYVFADKYKYATAFMHKNPHSLARSLTAQKAVRLGVCGLLISLAWLEWVPTDSSCTLGCRSVFAIDY